MFRFNINPTGIEQLALDLAASEKQVAYAMTRALSRTATTLRTIGARRLRTELQLRTISLLRKRLKSMQRRASSAVWFGLNDMPVSWFKGTPRASGPGQFLATSKIKGRKTVFKRIGAGRLPIEEQLKTVDGKADKVIEKELFEMTEAVFWNHFQRDLRARVKYQLGDR